MLYMTSERHFILYFLSLLSFAESQMKSAGTSYTSSRGRRIRKPVRRHFPPGELAAQGIIFYKLCVSCGVLVLLNKDIKKLSENGIQTWEKNGKNIENPRSIFLDVAHFSVNFA